MPEMPDQQVENEQPREAVQPSREERIPASQAAAQDPGMAASGFAALEAQAAKMRAEAEQAAGLNERLAAHAGVNAAAEKKVEMPGTTAPDMSSGTLENSQTEKKTAAQPQVPVKKPEQAAREQRIQSGQQNHVDPAPAAYQETQPRPTVPVQGQQSQAGQPVMSQPAQGQQQAAAGVPQQSSADQKAARVSQAQGVIRMERAGRNTEAAATQQNPYQQAAYRPNQSLTLSQQQLFSYFSTIQGLQEQIACAMNNQGRITAFDLYPGRVQLINALMKQTGVNIVEASVHDASVAADGMYDRILLDVPCSGLGDLAHKPEIRYHLKPENLDQLIDVQQKILNAQALRLKEGGRFVYSTCTLDQKENAAQIRCFLQEHPQFSLCEEHTWFPQDLHGSGFYGALVERVHF